jgi:hypothetical protein
LSAETRRHCRATHQQPRFGRHGMP